MKFKVGDKVKIKLGPLFPRWPGDKWVILKVNKNSCEILHTPTNNFAVISKKHLRIIK